MDSEKQSAMQQIQEQYSSQVKSQMGSAIVGGIGISGGNSTAADLFKNYAKVQGISRAKDTTLTIRGVENGRIIYLGDKQYICPQGTALLDIIGQALVEAQLEK